MAPLHLREGGYLMGLLVSVALIRPVRWRRFTSVKAAISRGPRGYRGTLPMELGLSSALLVSDTVFRTDEKRYLIPEEPRPSGALWPTSHLSKKMLNELIIADYRDSTS